MARIYKEETETWTGSEMLKVWSESKQKELKHCLGVKLKSMVN